MKVIATIILLTLLHNSAQGHASPGTIIFVVFVMISIACRRKPKQTASSNAAGTVPVSPAKFVGVSAVVSFVLIVFICTGVGNVGRTH